MGPHVCLINWKFTNVWLVNINLEVREGRGYYTSFECLPCEILSHPYPVLHLPFFVHFSLSSGLFFYILFYFQIPKQYSQLLVQIYSAEYPVVYPRYKTNLIP
jgi:hypothetical protein